MAELSLDRLRLLLRYDPDTGDFWNLITRGQNKRARAGQLAGWIRPDGYVEIRVDGQKYPAHRLAWFYMTGRWPAHEVDHLNGVKSDNRWANLRDVGRSTNMEDQRRAQKGSSTGLLGVSRHRASGKFLSQIWVRGRHRYLGIFDTPEAAHSAYLNAKRALHEGCTV